jgi:hypothetical protein
MATPITPNRSYPLPDPTNPVASDVYRIVAALTAIDTDIAAALVSIAARAAAVHGHAIADVAGLQGALDGKSGTSHAHALDDLTDVSGASAAPAGNLLVKTASGWVPAAPSTLGLAGQSMTTYSETVASGPKSTFTIPGGYVVGGIVVAAKGSVLQPSVDFTASDGSTVTLGTPLATGEDFTLLKFPSVTLGVPAAKVVTNEILADMPTARVKGRSSAGTGAPEDITMTQLKALLGLGTGDIAGLASALAAKSDVGHTHSASQITDLATVLPITKTWASAEQAITTGGTYTFSHTLGEAPKILSAYLVCKVADNEFAVGDRVFLSSGPTSGSNNTELFAQIGGNSSQVKAKLSAYSSVTMKGDPFNPANWRLVVRGYA